MTDLQRKLDSVISNVQRKLAKDNQLIPVKIANGVRVGNVDIINDGHLKNLYQRNELRYRGISLNKVAVKMANLMAISYFQNQTQIDELYRADQQFGQALEDYQIFRAKYQQAADSARADIMLARLCYSKDKANYYKNQALRLAQ